jgi:putative sigma-54 modulation protein
MNDFPSMEDRAAGTAAESFGSASRSDGTNRINGNFIRTGPPSALIQNQPIRRIMNRQNNQHEVIVSGIHLELTPSLKTFVREKVERLFRHEERIVRLRVELECDAKEEVGTRFKAKGHVVIQGPDMNAMVQADECHKAVALLVDKLDRMLSRRAQLYRVRRHNLHPVEIEAELP